LKVKKAEQEDIERLVPLAKKWAEELEYFVQEEDIKNDLSYFQKVGAVFFIEDEGEIRGMMSAAMEYLFWVDQMVANENWFVVHPKYRGKGYGAALDAIYTAWAKSMGCKSVMITPNKFGTMDVEKSVERLKKLGYGLHGVKLRKEI